MNDDREIIVLHGRSVEDFSRNRWRPRQAVGARTFQL